MNCIFVNKTNFDQMWAGEVMQDFLYPDSRILIFHFAEDHSYDFISFDYEEDILRPFLTFGISPEQIQIIDPYAYEESSIQFLLQQNFDCVAFVGNDPYQAHLYFEDYRLLPWFSSYDGTLLWIGEIGYVASAHFPIPYEDYEAQGLELVEIDISLNYIHDEEHLGRVIRLLEEGSQQVVLIPEQGGFYALDHYYDLFGQAMLVSDQDLDHLYAYYRI